jgi:integrase/recombinase XerD
MLSLYRRHLKRCGHRVRTYKKCTCPIWVQGTLHGKSVRKSLDIYNWDSAQKLVREWEGGTQSEVVMLSDAFDRFLDDCLARGVGPAQRAKYKLMFEDMRKVFKGRSVKLSADDLAEYRQGWTVGTTTKRSRLGRLRTFFKFCMERGWIQGNPAKLLKPPKEERKQVQPFSDDEIEKILWAVDLYPDRPYGRRNDLRAFVLVLRYTGLRIGDVVSLRRSALKDGKLLLQTQKTGSEVWMPLPQVVLDALGKVIGTSGYWFWSGDGAVRTCVGNWQRSLRTLFKLAGVKNAFPHKFRHTFSTDLLSKGVSVETVSVLLGHGKSSITQKFYSAWIKSRQVALTSEIEKAWKLA